MKIRFNRGPISGQLEALLDLLNCLRPHQFAITIENEPILRPIEDDATARPILIFMGAHNRTRRRVQLARPSPALPNLVMAGTEGQAIAIWFGFVQLA